MEYYFNEEGKCLVVDLREEDPYRRESYENILDKFKYLEQESYEDNLYHIYMNTEGDWESLKELTIDLDYMAVEFDIADIENSIEDLDYVDYSLEELDYRY